MERESPLGHQPALDGLRGVAVAAVVLYHAFRSWLPGGFLGVDLFFVLSGFLITNLLVEEHRRTGTISIRGFYIRRVRRLVPALVAFLVVETTVIALVEGWSATRGNSLLAVIGYSANWYRASGHPFVEDLSHMWSLAMEEQFYLLWPLLVWGGLRAGLSKRTLLLLSSGLVALVLVHRIDVWSSPRAGGVYSYPDTRVDELLIGCAAAFAWKLGWRPTRALAAVAAAILMIVAFGFDVARWNGALHTWGFTVLGIAAAVCVAASPSFRYLEWAPLRSAGRISYALYLWHMPMLYLLRGGTPIEGSVMSGVAALALTVVAAMLSWRWVERRFLAQRHTPGPWLMAHQMNGFVVPATKVRFAPESCR